MQALLYKHPQSGRFILEVFADDKKEESSLEELRLGLLTRKNHLVFYENRVYVSGPFVGKMGFAMELEACFASAPGKGAQKM